MQTKTEATSAGELPFKELFNFVTDPVYISDMDGNIIGVNEQACRELGYSREELLTKHVTELDAVYVDPKKMADNFKNYSASSTFTFEAAHRRKDATVFPVEINVQLIDYNGRQAIIGVARNVTERKRAEQALLSAESRYKSILQTSMDGFWLLDSGGNLLEVNDAYCAMSGYCSEELISMNIQDLEARENASETAAHIQNVITLGEDRFESMHRRKDGSTFPVEISVQHKPENGGYQVVFLRDITRRKSMEEAFARNERFLNTIIETEPECIKMLDEEGKLLMMNRAGLEMIQADSFEQVKGQCVCPLVTEPYRADFMELTKRVFQGQSGTLEFETVGLKGRRIWLETHAVPFRNETGEITALLGITRNITERKKNIESLNYANECFNQTLNGSRNILYRLNVRTGYDYLSPAFEAVTGHPLEEYKKTNLEELAGYYHPDDLPGARALVDQALRSRTGPSVSFELEYRFRKADGSYCWLHDSTTACFSNGGELEYFFGSAYDITERKKSEEEKLALEQQLQQAQKLESLGVLAGGIAHDFNNLLAVIIGHCSLAKLKPAKALDSLLPIETAAQRAAGLCQQMLAYAGKSNFIQSEIHLDELVEEMIAMANSSVGKNVTLTSSIASGIPSITVDASQIRQVVMNLIINASEAIGEAQGEVIVRLAQRVITSSQHTYDYLGGVIPPGEYACLEISDNGCGMDDETQRRIFEPFYTTKFTGRGLGMSAVLGIINRHNGALQLFSTPGAGTTFKVYLPVQTGGTDRMQSLRQDTPAHWKSNDTILLVEDEEDILAIAEMMLEELGLTVVKARNGKEALELFQKNKADISIVLTDIGMPVMDGYTLFRELKKLKPELPVIISSGFGDNDITSRIPRDEIAGLVSKPYNLEQLKGVLKAVSG